MSPRVYASPEAFKQALEQRLRTATDGGGELARRRQRVVFDRFLARIAHALGDDVTLKGGLVLELRLARARATKDVDLRVAQVHDALLDRLRVAMRADLDDFLTFTVTPDAEHPVIRSEGMLHEGLRFRAECRLAGKVYGQPFGVDAAFGDPMLGDGDLITTPDVLSFAGVASPTLRVYPVETHVAEKLHAYTMPRARPNTRVKDLPDIALLSMASNLEASRLLLALEQTFTFRATHPLPPELPRPPDAWFPPYAAMARNDGLPWARLDDVFAAAAAFLDPVLRGEVDARWDAAVAGWTPT